MNINLNPQSIKRDSGYGRATATDDGQGGAWALGGAVVGGLAGGIGAYTYSRGQIDKLPVNSQTVSWEAPTTKNTVLGQVPNDYYQPGFMGWSSGTTSSHDVNSSDYGGTNVTGASGNVVTHTETKTYSDHGVPVVTMETRPVRSPYMDPHRPYNETTMADTHTENDGSYTDANGDTHTNTREVIDGYWHFFHPVVGYQQQQLANGSTSYQVPVVHFETGVNTAANVLGGLAGGAALGAVSGYLLHKALSH